MKLSMIPMALVLIFLAQLTSYAYDVPSGRPDRTATGYYCWPAEKDGVDIVRLQYFQDPEFKKKFWQDYKREFENGNRRYFVLSLAFVGCSGITLPELGEACAQIERMLAPEEGIETYPELLYGIVASEEHTLDQIPVLNGIYDFCKSKWNFNVFQWLSEPLEPDLSLKVDGWIFDAYSVPGESFYRHLQKFLITGKPVFPVIWAAEPYGAFFESEDGSLAKVKANATKKIAYCTMLDTPVFLFAVCKEHGSVHCWMHEETPLLAELRDFFFPALANAVVSDPPSIGIPENYFVFQDGRYSFSQKGNSFSLTDNCNLQGAADTLLTGDGLVFGAETALEWCFVTTGTIRQAEVAIQATGQAELEYSWNGREWFPAKSTTIPCDSGGSERFYCRISGTPLVLKQIDFNFTGEAGRNVQLELAPDADGAYAFTEDFSSDAFWKTASYSSRGNLRPPGNRPFLTGPEWQGMQKVVFAKPVRRIVLTVDMQADMPNWASSASCAISLDGEKPVAEQRSDPEKRAQTVTVEFGSASPVTECYLHFALKNASGIYTDQYAPALITKYELNAR